jgi:hypothetical protein
VDGVGVGARCGPDGGGAGPEGGAWWARWPVESEAGVVAGWWSPRPCPATSGPTRHGVGEAEHGGASEAGPSGDDDWRRCGWLEELEEALARCRRLLMGRRQWRVMGRWRLGQVVAWTGAAAARVGGGGLGGHDGGFYREGGGGGYGGWAAWVGRRWK